MRTKKLFSMKKVMRTMALGLATMLVVGSVNVMEVEADNVFSPYYNTTSGKYEYNPADVFGVATHVHLFGNKVTTTAHTHGNVMATRADLGEIGMRDGKIAYPSDYVEYSYAGEWVALSQVTVHNPLIIGPNMEYSLASGKPQGVITNADGVSTANALTVYDGVWYTDGVTAVDIQGTLDDLADLSKSWAANATSTGVEVKLTAVEDMNNRTINVHQEGRANDNVYVNVSYEDWIKYGTYITLKGLDSTVTNKGNVIINIDMTNAPQDGSADLSGNDMKAFDTAGKEYNNTEHTTAAFGSCRVVYNLYEKDGAGNIQPYDGTVTFDNIVFGSILAPRAKVTVGAINGNVMANEIIHSGQESHRMDITPVFSVLGSGDIPNKIGKEDISLLLKLQGTADATDFYNDPAVDDSKEPIESNTKYTLYADEACSTPVYTANTTDKEKAANAAFNKVNAVWNEDAKKYEILIGSEYVTEYLSENGEYWLKKDAISAGYDDNNVIFKVMIDGDGKVTYAKVEGGSTGAAQSAVMTDVLTKSMTPVNIEDIVLNLDLKGDDAQESGFSNGRDSETTYQLYTDKDCTIPVAGKDGAATWVGDTYQITIPGSGLNTNTTYYLEKDAITTNYKDNKTIYEIYVEPTGNILYRVTDTGTFTGSRQQGPMTDVLVLPNGPAKLNVVFSNPDNAAPTGDVTYKIYTQANKNSEVASSASTVVSSGTSGSVTFGTTITDELEQDTVYYIGVSGNGSDHKDEIETFYQVKFDSATGNALYNNGTWNTTPYTDKLIKNEGIQLNVTLEGDTSTGTDSNVKYNVYDSTGNPVLDSSVSATKGSSDTTYKVVVDTAVTTDKLKRQPEVYYIAIDTNSSGYDDKVPNEKFWVKFDNNGNAKYSKDKQTWSDEPLEDILVKATTNNPPSSEPGSEPSSQPTNPPAGDSGNNGNNAAGGNAGSGGTPGIADPGTNNGGASNNAGNNTAGDNTNKGTADGANANNSATDGANANNSAVTGSNSMNSAKTGEVQTVYIFAGFAALIAIAAGVYVFIKRKRA